MSENVVSAKNRRRYQQRDRDNHHWGAQPPYRPRAPYEQQRRCAVKARKGDQSIPIQLLYSCSAPLANLDQFSDPTL